MKKLLFILSIAALASCKQEPVKKDYVTLSGTIENPNSDSLVIQNRGFNKTIKVAADGTFKDTLKVKKGLYQMFDGNEYAMLYLNNGDDINITLNTKEFDETIKFTGAGSENSTFLSKKMLLQDKLFTPDLLDVDSEEEFGKVIDGLEKQFSDFLDQNANIDSTLLANERTQLTKMKEGMMQSFTMMKKRKEAMAEFIGKPSPSFDFENVKGGKTTLADLKGKYVYVDIWATWCGPCKREIPYLKEVEKEFHGKNIEFVSISVDDGRGYKGDAAAAKEGWKKMIAEKELGGVQLLADKGWKSDFVQGYQINGIPRFILIGPDGKIVNADAPRPSSAKLKELFGSLNI